MKRWKCYIVGADGEAAGPYGCTYVRDWKSYGLLGDRSLICKVGTEEWVQASTIPELCTQTESHMNTINAVLARERKPISDLRRAALRDVKSPFPEELIDDELAERLINELVDLKSYTENVRKVINPQIERATNGKTQWREEPAATDKQIRYIIGLGGKVHDGMTIGEAGKIIDFLLTNPITEGQIRRLTFYGYSDFEGMSKTDATKAIDAFIRTHPESEDRYQLWKLSQRNRPEKKSEFAVFVVIAVFLAVVLLCVLTYFRIIYDHSPRSISESFGIKKP